MSLRTFWQNISSCTFKLILKHFAIRSNIELGLTRRGHEGTWTWGEWKCYYFAWHLLIISVYIYICQNSSCCTLEIWAQLTVYKLYLDLTTDQAILLYWIWYRILWTSHLTSPIYKVYKQYNYKVNFTFFHWLFQCYFLTQIWTIENSSFFKFC